MATKSGFHKNSKSMHEYGYRSYLNMIGENHALFSLRILACANALDLVWC